MGSTLFSNPTCWVRSTACYVWFLYCFYYFYLLWHVGVQTCPFRFCLKGFPILPWQQRWNVHFFYPLPFCYCLMNLFCGTAGLYNLKLISASLNRASGHLYSLPGHQMANNFPKIHGLKANTYKNVWRDCISTLAQPKISYFNGFCASKNSETVLQYMADLCILASHWKLGTMEDN